MNRHGFFTAPRRDRRSWALSTGDWPASRPWRGSGTVAARTSGSLTRARPGQTCELDELTFLQALAGLPLIPEGVHLSVNASPALLMKPAFREDVLTSGLPLDRIVIEITEHARVPSYTDLHDALEPLRERGIRFAIDDTGAGYASLSHVLELHPDIIKLDRALINSLEQDRPRRSLVTALVLLALDVGASVTGEGVETAGQLEAPTTLGVDQAQGYFLARPSTDPDTWQSWWAHQRGQPMAFPIAPGGATRRQLDDGLRSGSTPRGLN